MTKDRDMVSELEGGGFIMEDLIDYQDDAIVSKTLIDKETGTLTVFAFDEGQSLSEHTAPHHAFLQVLDGEVKVTIDGEGYELSRGETVVMPANKPHAVEALSQFKMLLIMIR